MSNTAIKKGDFKELTQAIAETALKNSVQKKDSFEAYAHYVQSKLFFENPDFEKRVARGYQLILDKFLNQ